MPSKDGGTRKIPWVSNWQDKLSSIAMDCILKKSKVWVPKKLNIHERHKYGCWGSKRCADAIVDCFLLHDKQKRQEGKENLGQAPQKHNKTIPNQGTFVVSSKNTSVERKEERKHEDTTSLRSLRCFNKMGNTNFNNRAICVNILHRLNYKKCAS